MKPGAALTRGETRMLVFLLCLLAEHLESAIESMLIPGENEPAAEDREMYDRERRRRRKVEDMLIVLERALEPKDDVHKLAGGGCRWPHSALYSSSPTRSNR